jgi:oligo-1,6-glucosidase
MDLVVNHSSDEHRWFVESRSSKTNPYRDYYIWRPGTDGHEPNNWFSFFSGSAWEYDAATNEYYLHIFSKKQPDLNWDNPQLRHEIFAMMRWWLAKGIDGFRMDVITLISKVPGLPDGPVTSADRYQWGGSYFVHGPRLLEFLQEMKQQALAGYDTLTVGEAPEVTTPQAIELTDAQAGPLNMLFQFEHMGLDSDESRGLGKWGFKDLDLRDLKRSISRWQKDLEGKGWNSLYLSNHDQPRALSRFGNDGQYRLESAKMLATFLHTLQGTPYVYQGEEIGMTNVRFESINDYRDIESLNMYREFVQERGMQPQAVLAMIYAKGRDNARTPMQWDAGEQAGFTSGTPWIQVNPNYQQINVAQAIADPNSIFAYYQQLIRLRKANPVIVYGNYDLVQETDAAIYAYTRTLEDDRLLIILNFSASTPTFALPAAMASDNAELLISNYPVDPAEAIAGLTLRPYEARVYRLG